MTPDFYFNLTPGDVVYDLETYPNAITGWFLHRTTRRRWYFEISDRRNDIVDLCKFMIVMSQQGCRGVGYNNLHFDYPILHFIYSNVNVGVGYKEIYNKAMQIIRSNGPAAWAHHVWDDDMLFPQVDLMSIHHFGYKAKSTSLKILEFNMRMDSVEDLPFQVGTVLTSDQIDILGKYNYHDVVATDMFCDRTEKMIKMREELTEKTGINMINKPNGKIGEAILTLALQEAGIKTHEYINNKKVKRQTKRETIDIAETIFPYVRFERPELQQILIYLQSKVITATKDVFDDLIADVDGIEYKIGTGGLHASITNKALISDAQYQLVDVDVESFYSNLAIKNRIYPAHLGPEFCDSLNDIFHDRKKFPKGTPENAAYKEALNVPYGMSNNDYSLFLDPFYTMSITINGQLLLLMLVEQLIKTPGLRMVQANTDGVTYLCPRQYLDHTRAVCRWWEQLTHLTLEENLYSRMFIRDVNSYIAEKENGELKRIGAYAHVTAEEDPATRELPHHKDWSARVVALAAEAALVRGADIRDFIYSHSDVYDFFLRAKVPKSSYLMWGEDRVSNVVRYYVSNTGKRLEKVMPASGPEGAFKRANGLTDAFYESVISELMSQTGESDRARLPWDERINTKNESRYEERRVGICTGWSVFVCNELLVPPDGGSQVININYDWYIKEAEKLVKPLIGE